MISDKELLVGLSDGTIGRIRIDDEKFENNSNESVPIKQAFLETIRDADGLVIQQIAIDYIQEKLYILHGAGALERCSIDSCKNSTKLQMTTANYVIQNIAVDSQNVFHF